MSKLRELAGLGLTAPLRNIKEKPSKKIHRGVVADPKCVGGGGEHLLMSRGWGSGGIQDPPENFRKSSSSQVEFLGSFSIQSSASYGVMVVALAL